MERINSNVGLAIALLLFFCKIIGTQSQGSDALVPAIITFGDSSVDVGNNDYIKTLFRADFPPYGRDFKNHQPTGRFCNGKLATDITAETLGFTTFPPAYLSPQASGKNLLIGANFASAGSGYYDHTSIMSHAIPLSQQLEYYQEFQSKLAKIAGSTKASSILSGALYLVSSGSSDFIQNYYLNPYLYKFYTPDEFSSFLVSIFTNFIKDLYGLGARKIGVTSLPPIGCVPATITLFGHGSNECVSSINSDAQGFNKKINAAANSLAKQLSGLKIAIFDIYTPFIDLVNNPSKSGASTKLFREYIGADLEGIRFTDVPIKPNVDFHFILSFAIDYTTAEQSTPTDGKFNVFWDTQRLQPIDVASIKSQYKNVRVAVSLGGDSVTSHQKAYFMPKSISSWVNNAVASLTQIIRTYRLDGIDIDYEHFKTDPNTFAECIGQLISTLKKGRVISFASIAPFEDTEVQSHYQALWRKYRHLIDYVNFQFYAYDKLSVNQFLGYFDKQMSNYNGGLLLASFATDGEAEGGLAPEEGFFVACEELKKQGKLGGIFIWSADDSMKNGYRFEEQSQQLLAAA